MGFGLGAAIGAAIGSKYPTVLITGDGSFGMNLNEMATAVSTNANVKIVVFNNGVLGMVRQWQTLFFKKHYSNTTLERKTDFVKLADSSIKNCKFKGQLTTNKSILSDGLNSSGAYKTSGYGDTQTIVLTSDSFQTAIASASYDGSAVAYEKNSFWEDVQ
jgi:acetolactate synthase-1/2/3 large subunit